MYKSAFINGFGDMLKLAGLNLDAFLPVFAGHNFEKWGKTIPDIAYRLKHMLQYIPGDVSKYESGIKKMESFSKPVSALGRRERQHIYNLGNGIAHKAMRISPSPGFKAYRRYSLL